MKKLLSLLAALLGGLLLSSSLIQAEPLITEFMASNKTTLLDEDGDYSDWIEIYNPDDVSVSLNGWSLTDNAAKKTKWTFPDVVLAPHAYLIVFASDKDRRDPDAPLHTSFSLSADGEYLGLVKPDGVTVVSEYAPSYPAQQADVSYGVTQPSAGESPLIGYFPHPTPGADNGDNSSLALLETPTFSIPPGLFVAPAALALGGAGAETEIRYTLTAPSAAGPLGETPTATSPLYTGPLALTTPIVIRAAVFLAGSDQHGPVATAVFTPIANSGDQRLDTFSTALPVLVLDDHGAGALDKYSPETPAWLTIFEPANGTTRLTDSPTVTTSTLMNVRGSASADFDKLSYSLKPQSEWTRDFAIAPLGLPASDNWALIGPWAYDRALLRNAFMYALSDRIGRWAPRTRFVETFFNHNGDSLDATDYTGIAVLTDRIKIAPDRVNIASLSTSDVTEPAITGGYIVKLDLPDSDEYSWRTARGVPQSGNGLAVVVHQPKIDKLADAQKDYIRNYIQQLEDALFADRDAHWATRHYTDYIDPASWVDFHLLNVLSGNIDALERSTYFSKDRGGKLVAGPLWDFDRALGSADPRDGAWNVWHNGVDFWNVDWWGVLFRDPEMMQAWIDRWQRLRNDTLSDDQLAGVANQLADQIPAAATAREISRWPTNRSRYGDYTGEITHLKNWVVNRAGWIDRQFLAAPTVVYDGKGFTVTAAPGSVLVYTTDGTDPRATGGAIAATAITTSEPLRVTGRWRVRARSFRSDWMNVYPGSPWSSVHGAGSAFNAVVAYRDDPSDNTPAVRLSNLSSRSNIAGGEQILINGLVVAGVAPKTILARAVGPGLARFGVQLPLARPVLQLLDAHGQLVAQNEAWTSAADPDAIVSLAATVGAFPLEVGDADSALIATVPPGVYTLQVSGADGGAGTALAEVYEADSTGAIRNLSARGVVSTGDGVLIGGLVVTGTTPRRLLVRGIGPGLSKFNVEHALPAPELLVFLNGGTEATAENWDAGSDAADIAQTAASVGAFALDPGSKDAAVLLTLNPGVYTLQLRSKTGEPGVGLLEVYDLP